VRRGAAGPRAWLRRAEDAEGPRCPKRHPLRVRGEAKAPDPAPSVMSGIRSPLTSPRLSAEDPKPLKSPPPGEDRVRLPRDVHQRGGRSPGVGCRRQKSQSGNHRRQMFRPSQRQGHRIHLPIEHGPARKDATGKSGLCHELTERCRGRAYSSITSPARRRRPCPTALPSPSSRRSASPVRMVTTSAPLAPSTAWLGVHRVRVR
jgi:hypothetical protein